MPSSYCFHMWHQVSLQILFNWENSMCGQVNADIYVITMYMQVSDNFFWNFRMFMASCKLTPTAKAGFYGFRQDNMMVWYDSQAACLASCIHNRSQTTETKAPCMRCLLVNWSSVWMYTVRNNIPACSAGYSTLPTKPGTRLAKEVKTGIEAEKPLHCIWQLRDLLNLHDKGQFII